MAVHILGISAFHHDSAACLVRDGETIAVAQAAEGRAAAAGGRRGLARTARIELSSDEEPGKDGMLMVLTQGSALAPFIYTLF